MCIIFKLKPILISLSQLTTRITQILKISLFVTQIQMEHSNHLPPVPKHDDSWLQYSELDQNKFTISLAMFSVASSLVTHPLNVLMTRQQAGVSSNQAPIHSSSSKSTVTANNPHASTSAPLSTSSSVTNELMRSVKTIGLAGLFRGFIPVACMGLPSNVIYLELTESTREALQSKLKSVFPKLSLVYFDGIQSFVSGLISNSVSLIPFVPADVLSARLIVQGRKDIGVYNMARLIYKEGGVHGFFRGYSISLIFCSLYSTQWWWSYSVCRRECGKIPLIRENPVCLDLAAGLVAGLVTTACLHPLDTIKTRIMTAGSASATILKHNPHSNSYYTHNHTTTDKICYTNLDQSARVTHSMPGMPSIKKSNWLPVTTGSGNHAVSSSFIRVFADVVRKEGHVGLWRGLNASMYHSVIASSGFAAVYELIKRFSLATVCSTE